MTSLPSSPSLPWDILRYVKSFCWKTYVLKHLKKNEIYVLYGEGRDYVCSYKLFKFYSEDLKYLYSMNEDNSVVFMHVNNYFMIVKFFESYTQVIFSKKFKTLVEKNLIYKLADFDLSKYEFEYRSYLDVTTKEFVPKKKQIVSTLNPNATEFKFYCR